MVGNTYAWKGDAVRDRLFLVHWTTRTNVANRRLKLVLTIEGLGARPVLLIADYQPLPL
jgi:hypothetical protein